MLLTECTNLSCRTLAVVHKSVTLFQMGGGLGHRSDCWEKGSEKVTDVAVMLVCWYIPGLSAGEREGTWEMGSYYC